MIQYDTNASNLLQETLAIIASEKTQNIPESEILTHSIDYIAKDSGEFDTMPTPLSGLTLEHLVYNLEH